MKLPNTDIAVTPFKTRTGGALFEFDSQANPKRWDWRTLVANLREEDMQIVVSEAGISKCWLQITSPYDHKREHVIKHHMPRAAVAGNETLGSGILSLSVQMVHIVLCTQTITKAM